jgi:hypothetical protein
MKLKITQSVEQFPVVIWLVFSLPVESMASIVILEKKHRNFKMS